MRNRRGPVPEHVWTKAFDKRHRHLSGKHFELRQSHQRGGHSSGRHALINQLGACREPEAAALDHLDIIVGKTNGAECECRAHRDPHQRIGGISPQHRRQQNCNRDQHPAHGRRAGLFQMGLRPVVANILADLKFAQFLNDIRSDEHGDHQRGKRSKSGAKSQIAEDPEWMEEGKQFHVQQPVKQEASMPDKRRDIARFYKAERERFPVFLLFYQSGRVQDGTEISIIVSLTTIAEAANRNAGRLRGRPAFSPECNLSVLGHFFHRDRIEERHGCAQLLADDLDWVLGFGITESLELLAAGILVGEEALGESCRFGFP